MKYKHYSATLHPRTDDSIKDIGFEPTHMLVVKQIPKDSLRVQRIGTWSDKQAQIFNPNSFDVQAEIIFYG